MGSTATDDCCFPIYDVVEVVVIFECVELGEEELVVSVRAVPCGEVWLWDV